MKIGSKNFLFILLLICSISLFSGTFGRPDYALPPFIEEFELPQDTGTIYPVRKTQITNYEDLTHKTPVDLRDPSNVKTEVEYDLNNNVYLFKTKIDNDEWITPFSLDPEQYAEYSLKRSMADYFKLRNAEAFAKKGKKEDFSLRDIRVNTGALERIFGPGGVQIKTQGYVEVSTGIKHTKVDNPTISPKNRSRFMFDFDEKIQLNATATVGNKIDFGLNYDTESTFDFDTKRIKLAYQGEEDEIIKHLEAGNVSMTTTNSLITGGSALFGIKADLQFGRLKINTVISQQESESQTVNSQGGVQTMSFEFKADEYDENQHFFLAQYFRDEFDRNMSNATTDYIGSGILLDKVEVWVTNKQGNFSNARNIVGFSDLGENEKIGNKKWQPTGTKNPYNKSNNLYSTITENYYEARDISKTTFVLNEADGFVSGLDYEKLESARMLDASEYTVNKNLGYISLNTALGSDQVLAVAYNYTKGGKPYQVGEFASEIPSEYKGVENTYTGALFVKLLKPYSLSPRSYTWDLMMKNVYKLGATQVQKDKFRLNIYYQSDTIGTYINYIPAGKIKDELLLSVMGLDRLNSQGKELPKGDGIFDFLEGLTILPENGRVIFPVVEPFGSHLKKKIGNETIAEQYIYQELYDSTLTVAQQIADKNKFKISGSYKASASSSVLNLNAMNVARGSVIVTANGTTLTEDVDYTVDYTAGTVNIINQALIDAGTPISVTLENQSLYNMRRKTLLGLNLSYEFSKNFTLGGTIMHMYEKPLIAKTGIGEESLKNTIWGLNGSYQTSSQWLTNAIDKLPFVEATAPSYISLNAEFAQLIAGHYENQYGGGYSYLDDFESARSKISVLQPYGWKLSSTPSSEFEEDYKSIGNIKYGNKRAHLAWFSIDNIFTRKNSSLRPSYLNKDSISDHRVRAIYQNEIYPERDIAYNQSATISTLNLSYYPQQRGVYNLDADGMGSDGKLLNPEKRWGGIMRKLENTNFESSNIEYIEFWLMDPFINNNDSKLANDGGELYFNLGEISEDVLRDGYKFYENGLPTSANLTETINTEWGIVPKRQSTVYAFDNALSLEDRIRQDAGFNGLITADEFEFPTYKTYLEQLRTKLSSETIERWEQDDRHSPFNDPSGDNYEYYRGANWDRERAGILERYKYYNGTEGNTVSSDLSSDNYSSAATPLPDVEDLNQDYTMNETEGFYQYKVALKPNQMNVGEGYISDLRTVSVTLENGNTDTVRWYQFKIPVREGEVFGNKPDFKAIRFMRMFLTGFKQETFLRFATLDLVRGDWRMYTQKLQDGINQGTGVLNVSAVNIEENSNKTPVNYVIPPGVSRIVDPNQAQLIQQNEQALSLEIKNLEAKDARAVYKNTNYDLRRYKRMQMFTHAEALIDDPDELKNGEITAFIRLGSDFRNNYYEYEIPLVVTPPGSYSSQSTTDQETVWPTANMFDFPLELLTNLKLSRNKEKRKAGSEVSYTTLYSEYDPDKVGNKISIIGNPSLSEVSVMMIGIRNNSTIQKSAEVWVNELRMTDYDEEGGWAVQGNLNVSLSDIGTVNLTGRKETAGFGAIDQSLMQRRNDDYSTYTISTSVDLGRFIPKQAKLSAPLYYSYSNQTTTPKYDPLDQDIKLKDALEVVETKQEKDSIKNLALDKTITKNFSLTNVKLNIQSKNPMPYDPANFSFGYAFSKTETSNPTTVYDLTQNYKATMSYSYSPLLSTWEPFKKVDSKSPWAKYPKSLGINLLPSNISFNSYITRYYTETLTRDLESMTLGGNNSANRFLTYSHNFYWDRDFSITWDFLRNLKLSLQTGTRAEIEEPYLQVNKKLNPDAYDTWKDAVMRSLRSFGDPLSYRQTAQVTYTLPLQSIPVLDWVNSAANYNSSYTWDRGNAISEVTDNGDTLTIETGNTITNTMTLNLTNKFDLTKLYNKSDFLKKANQKFESNRRTQQRPTREKPAIAKKPFQKDVQLNADSGTIVKHNLKTKNILVTAKQNGKNIKIKYKRIDENTIRINTKDSTLIKINVVDKGTSEETTLYKVAQYGARGLMSVRSLSFNYSLRNENAISGFSPGIGDAFGQKNSAQGMTPGLGFAFGLEGGDDFIQKSLDNGWLIASDKNITSTVYNSIKKIELEAQLEPLKALKIRLTGIHEKNERTSYDFGAYSSSGNLTMNDATRTLGGSFTMSTVAISTSFSSGNAKNNYKSKGFDKFIKNRDIIANRLSSKYNGLKYPNSGFLVGTGLPGNYYSNNNQAFNKNSADVLIPAFLAAYTGKDANKISFSPFPTLTSLIPNWAINYEGLTTLPWFKDRFRNFRLMHGYTAQYRIGSYGSHLTWVEAENGFGFTQGLSGESVVATPSSQYDISSVSIVEQFNPLFGADGTLNNNLTFNARYNYSRTLNLNITAYQLVETLQKDLVLGMGYKINEFNRLIGLPIKSNKNFNNDLTVKGDLSRRTSQSLIRKIEEQFTEATSGTTILTLKISAEYTLSKALLLKMYFDRVVNTPLISSSSYPTANTNFGFSLRFTLTQ